LREWNSFLQGLTFYNKTAKTTGSPRFGEAGLPVDEAARKNGEAAQSVSNTTASAVDIYWRLFLHAWKAWRNKRGKITRRK